MRAPAFISRNFRPAGLILMAFFLMAIPWARADETTHTLEIQRHRGAPYVAIGQYMRLISDILPGAQAQWDPISGILRVESGATRIDALSRRPSLIVNGALERAELPVLISNREVLVPVSTLKRELQILGVDFEFEIESEDASPTPETTPVLPELTPQATPAPDIGKLEDFVRPEPVPDLPAPGAAPTPDIAPELTLDIQPETAATPEPALTPPASDAAATLRPQATATPFEIAIALPVETPQATPAPVRPLTAEEADLPAVDARNLPPIDAPERLGTVVGLSWGQLADLRHRSAPRRVVIVHDPALEAVAEQIRASSIFLLGLDIRLIAADEADQRDSERLLQRVKLARPGLTLDLMRDPDPKSPLRVWTLHEALWPEDRARATGQDKEAEGVYQAHQFQSLALGSLLRRELGRRHPGCDVRFELFPSFLMRRVDSPSAIITIPAPPEKETAEEDTARVNQLAGAITAGISSYVKAMQAVAY